MIYVFLYQNLNLKIGIILVESSSIYVFLYQNLNDEVDKTDEIEEENLCISILEFKWIK